MDRFYKIAGMVFRITADEESFPEDDGILGNFRTEPAHPDHTVCLNQADPLPVPEGDMVFAGGDVQVFSSGQTRIQYKGVAGTRINDAYMRIARYGNTSHAAYRPVKSETRFQNRMMLYAMELEHQIVRHHGFFLHASYIEVNGTAILFTAPSGTGKSTQAALWCRLRGAKLINGDRVAVMWKDGRAWACGVPYAGMSGVSLNRTLPLSEIVVLSQAEHTHIDRISGVNAFRSVWKNCSINIWDSEDMSRCSDTVIRVLQEVAVYELACTPDESAVIALELAMRK